jgi:hypothetical protein
VPAPEKVDGKEQFFVFLFLWPFSIPRIVSHGDIIFYVDFFQGS